MSTTIRDRYDRFISAIRDLEKVLGPAVAAQYEAPPGGSGELAPNGIPNPTLDTVIDPRRLTLSEAIGKTSELLGLTTEQLAAQTAQLSGALSRWEGSTGGN